MQVHDRLWFGVVSQGLSLFLVCVGRMTFCGASNWSILDLGIWYDLWWPSLMLVINVPLSWLLLVLYQFCKTYKAWPLSFSPLRLVFSISVYTSNRRLWRSSCGGWWHFVPHVTVSVLAGWCWSVCMGPIQWLDTPAGVLLVRSHTFQTHIITVLQNWCQYSDP